jgi:mRNA interferase RelE/StbE
MAKIGLRLTWKNIVSTMDWLPWMRQVYKRSPKISSLVKVIFSNPMPYDVRDVVLMFSASRWWNYFFQQSWTVNKFVKLGLNKSTHYFMNYPVQLKPRALKDLTALSPENRGRILVKLERLQNNLTGDVKRLTNFTPEYHLRVGDYRVLYRSGRWYDRRIPSQGSP